jgi:translation elongation factor EF-4
MADQPVDALPGFQPMKAMVFAGVFPVDTSDFHKLEEAIERVCQSCQRVLLFAC